MRNGRFAVIAALCAGACAEPPAELGRIEARIIAGEPSADDGAVYVVTTGAEGTLRCSGRIVAPGLAVTARHCVLKRKTVNLVCRSDGTAEEGDTDLRLEPAANVTIFIGARRTTARPVAVREVIANEGLTICRSDVAFLVLAERGLDLRTPLRRSPAFVHERVRITGWGYTTDRDRTDLPEERSTVETEVADVGPGRIPPGSFSFNGRTTCLGDSGAGILSRGSLIGIYSRISNPDACEARFSRNIATDLSGEPELTTRAFAAIGEEPYYEGDELPDAGAIALDPKTDEESPGADARPSPPREESSSCRSVPCGREDRGFTALAIVAAMACRRIGRGGSRPRRCGRR